MRKVMLQLIGLLSLLALAACQPAIATPAVAPRATLSPTPATVQVSLFAISQQHAVVALDPASGSVFYRLISP